MYFQASVIEASELYCFAEKEGIAYYNEIQNIIFRGDADNSRRHDRWFRPCFAVGIDEFDEYWGDDRINWLPKVERMVRDYMSKHNIETLLIVTTCYVLEPPTKADRCQTKS